MVLHVGTNQSTLRKLATWHGLTRWDEPEHSEDTSSFAWSCLVEQTRALWGNQQPCMVLHGGTNQSTLREPAILYGLTWWNKPEHSEETSNLAWSYMVEQTRALWGNQQPCMVLHGGTNQSTLRKQQDGLFYMVEHTRALWGNQQHSEETSTLAWSYMVEQTSALWGNQQPCMVLHGGTNQTSLRKPAALHGLMWWNKPEHSEGTSNLAWSYMVEQTRDSEEPEHSDETINLAWSNMVSQNKPEHSEGTRNLAWSYMVEQTRALWGNQKPCMFLHGGTNQSTLREPAILDGLTWWNKPEHSEGTRNLAWSYMVEQTRALWGNQQPSMVLHGGTNQSTLREPETLHGLTWWNKPEYSEETRIFAWSYMVEHTRALWGNKQPYMVLHGGTNQNTLRKPTSLHNLTWWNKQEHSEETGNLCMVLYGGTKQRTLKKPATLHGLTWWNKPEHSEETSSSGWFYMVEYTRAHWGNQQHSEETSNLAWSYMV